MTKTPLKSKSEVEVLCEIIARNNLPQLDGCITSVSRDPMHPTRWGGKYFACVYQNTDGSEVLSVGSFAGMDRLGIDSTLLVGSEAREAAKRTVSSVLLGARALTDRSAATEGLKQRFPKLEEQLFSFGLKFFPEDKLNVLYPYCRLGETEPLSFALHGVGSFKQSIGSMRGLFYQPRAKEEQERVYVCEGAATACAIALILPSAFVVSVGSKSLLMDGVKVLKEHFDDIWVCLDRDGDIESTVKKLFTVGVVCVAPTEGAEKGRDFRDMYLDSSLEACVAALTTPLTPSETKEVEEEEEEDQDNDSWEWSSSTSLHKQILEEPFGRRPSLSMLNGLPKIQALARYMCVDKSGDFYIPSLFALFSCNGLSNRLRGRTKIKRFRRPFYCNAYYLIYGKPELGKTETLEILSSFFSPVAARVQRRVWDAYVSKQIEPLFESIVEEVSRGFKVKSKEEGEEIARDFLRESNWIKGGFASEESVVESLYFNGGSTILIEELFETQKHGRASLINAFIKLYSGCGAKSTTKTKGSFFNPFCAPSLIAATTDKGAEEAMKNKVGQGFESRVMTYEVEADSEEMSLVDEGFYDDDEGEEDNPSKYYINEEPEEVKLIVNRIVEFLSSFYINPCIRSIEEMRGHINVYFSNSANVVLHNKLVKPILDARKHESKITPSIGSLRIVRSCLTIVIVSYFMENGLEPLSADGWLCIGEDHVNKILPYIRWFARESFRGAKALSSCAVPSNSRYGECTEKQAVAFLLDLCKKSEKRRKFSNPTSESIRYLHNRGIVIVPTITTKGVLPSITLIKGNLIENGYLKRPMGSTKTRWTLTERGKALLTQEFGAGNFFEF